MTTTNKIIDFFDEASCNWDDKHCDTQGAKKIIDVFKPYIFNKTILDVGCGTGVLYPYLKKASAKSIKAIDISPKMVEIAKTKYRDDVFFCEDIYTLNECEKFDLIILFNSYPHFLDAQMLVDKIYELLNKSGRFIIAHGASKEEINSHHKAHALGVSRKLLGAQEESKLWNKYFNIDCTEDSDIYYFSGEKN